MLNSTREKTQKSLLDYQSELLTVKFYYEASKKTRMLPKQYEQIQISEQIAR